MRLSSKIIIAILILFVALGVSTVFSRRVEKKTAQPQNQNKTKAVEIASIQIDSTLSVAKILLKNVSNESVTAIQLASNKGSLRIEFLDACRQYSDKTS